VAKRRSETIMCGIVGYVGGQNAAEIVLEGLQRLEYRGYDSAGIAVYDREAGLCIHRSVGKLKNLVARLENQTIGGPIGVGHTRWATHGGVTSDNAHPHCDQSGTIVVVQNGIVENYQELKDQLVRQGHTFRSQTDTEVIAHLIGDYYQQHQSLAQAVRYALGDLRGGNAVVVFCVHEPEVLVVARLGNAGGVVIGLGDGENFIASDLPAVLDHTRQVVFLEDRDIATVSRDRVQIGNLSGESIRRSPMTMAWDPVAAAKGPYRHFMQKEIHEQPRALTDVLRGHVDLEAGTIHLQLDAAALQRVRRIYAVACGTAWHAALVSKFMIETLAGVRVEVDYASEFRYRQPLLDQDSLLLAFTQSGETVDTLAAMEEARSHQMPCVSIVNVIGSQAERLADGGAIHLHAGPEIGVASTKCFTSMLIAAYLFALNLAQTRRMLTLPQVRDHLQALVELPGKAARIIDETWPLCEMLADRFYRATDALYLGRQANYPIALEGALKLKEISYIHAEGYPAGEMKHGPIALIDENLPVVCIAPRDGIYEKMLSNIEQVKARNGQVIAIASESDALLSEKADYLIPIPETWPLLTPVLAVIPLQLLAYAFAVKRGCDVDQPRNLAKSVTVE
jgi:glucosamine--fructose-6-phosphate aminotransferase (isomerizing)